MAFLRYSVLAARILLWVMLAALVVFFLATGFGIVHERDEALRTAHASVEEAVRQSLPALSISLWQYDTAGMDALLAGMLRSTAIVAIEVADLHKVVAGARQAGVAGAIDKVWETPVMSPDGSASIGVLRISESFAQVNAQAMASLRTLVLVDLLKIIGLAAILFTIVYRKVARHLYQLAEDVTHLGQTSGVPQVAIVRKKTGNYRDEFDILVDTINSFLAERSEEMRRRTVAEGSLRERVSEIEATLGALSDGVIAVDRDARIRYANGAACALLHASPVAIKEQPMDEVLQVINAVDGSVFCGLSASVIAEGEALHLRDDILIRTGASAGFDARISAVPVPGTGDVAMILVFTDISEEVRNQQRIKFQAFHDPLTRLGNRSLLVRDLARDIEQTQRSSGCLAALCLDLDNFKNINDTLGHTIGYIMLKQLAQRREATVGSPGWVTRHGGDEFIVVLPRIASVEPAIALAEALMATIAEPFHIESHELRITSSIGISLCPEHGSGIGELLSKSDLAMYAAKRQSKNTYRIFEASLLERSTARLTMENGLRVA
ncbi:MAG: diguanylate cyclase, partial [Hydrocarboniphaga effusa]|nr:diguanylate cyclase [Hydrocarboniphaga effusa]